MNAPDQHDCPLCRPETDRIQMEGEFATAIPDEFADTEGHALVLSRRHVASMFDLPEREQAAVRRLVSQVRAYLMAELRPDGFNVGLNDGPALSRLPRPT